MKNELWIIRIIRDNIIVVKVISNETLANEYNKRLLLLKK